MTYVYTDEYRDEVCVAFPMYQNAFGTTFYDMITVQTKDQRQPIVMGAMRVFLEPALTLMIAGGDNDRIRKVRGNNQALYLGVGHRVLFSHDYQSLYFNWEDVRSGKKITMSFVVSFFSPTYGTFFSRGITNPGFMVSYKEVIADVLGCGLREKLWV